MPRGVRKPTKTISEQIEVINQSVLELEDKIANSKIEIKDLIRKKKDLLKEQEKEELAKLKNFIDETGMSIEEATQKFRDKVFSSKK